LEKHSQPWEFLGRTPIYESPHRGFVVERVRTHTGAEMDYGYLEAPPAVLVVPLTMDSRVVLIRQYRVPVREWVWEVPAGAVGDEPPEAAARRELAEEVGGTCARLQAVSWWYGLPSAVTSQHHLYFASGVTLREPRHEATELVQVVPVQPEQALAWARAGVIRSAESALALLLCEPLLRSSPPSRATP
jgi:ADP-ribose pyrophosphatase